MFNAMSVGCSAAYVVVLVCSALIEMESSAKPPISQSSVVLCSMLMFRMGKEARKQMEDENDGFFHNSSSPYHPVPLLIVAQILAVLLLSAILFLELLVVRERQVPKSDIRKQETIL
jgi:hypothetical protein